MRRILLKRNKRHATDCLTSNFIDALQMLIYQINLWQAVLLCIIESVSD